MARFKTSWLCAHCGRPLEQTNTSRRRRTFRHKEARWNLMCHDITAVSIREYRADLRAIENWLIEGLTQLERQGYATLEYNNAVTLPENAV